MLEDKIFDSKHFERVVFDFEPKNKSTKCISFVNPYSYSILNSSVDSINDIDYLYIDGILLVSLHNFFFSNVDRVSFDFSSVADLVLSQSLSRSYKIMLIGGSVDEAKKTQIKLRNKYCDQISVHDGFFDDSTKFSELVSKCQDFDIFVLGLGTPMQEQYSSIIKSLLPKGKLVFTCGGFITQTSIKSDYYHPIIKKTGLRWLQRALLSKHVRRRLIFDYPMFIVKYLKNNISRGQF